MAEEQYAPAPWIGTEQYTGVTPASTIPANFSETWTRNRRNQLIEEAKNRRDRVGPQDPTQWADWIMAQQPGEMERAWERQTPEDQAKYNQAAISGNPWPIDSPQFWEHENQYSYDQNVAQAEALWNPQLQGGYTAQERAQIEQDKQKADMEYRGKVEGMRKDLQARGVYGGGQGIASAQQAAQDSAQRRALTSLQQAAAVQARQTEARKELQSVRDKATEGKTTAGRELAHLAGYDKGVEYYMDEDDE